MKNIDTSHHCLRQCSSSSITWWALCHKVCFIFHVPLIHRANALASPLGSSSVTWAAFNAPRDDKYIYIVLYVELHQCGQHRKQHRNDIASYRLFLALLKHPLSHYRQSDQVLIILPTYIHIVQTKSLQKQTPILSLFCLLPNSSAFFLIFSCMYQNCLSNTNTIRVLHLVCTYHIIYITHAIYAKKMVQLSCHSCFFTTFYLQRDKSQDS